MVPGTLWHDLYPWPITDGQTWRAIAGYVQDETTRQTLDELDRDRRYPNAIRRHLHDLGVSRFFADPLAEHPANPGDPAEHGSATLTTAPHTCGLAALLASVNTSLAITVGVNLLALLPAYIAATPEQLAWLTNRLRDGAYCALGLTEFDRGSDLLRTETIAAPGALAGAGEFVPRCAPAGGASHDPPTHYRLTGRKDLINGAREHELRFVFARTKARAASAMPGSPPSPLAGFGNFSLFLVTEEPGIGIARRWQTVPAPGADISSLQLDGVIVPASARIGRDGDGFPIVQQCLAMSRCGIGALASGLATRAARMAHGYAASRHIYGQPLAALGAIADHLLRMRALELLATAISVKATVQVNRYGPGAAYLAAMTKLSSCALADELIAEGRLLHGSRALLVDEPYHRILSDAALFGTFDGTMHVVLGQIQGWLAQISLPAASAPDDLAPWRDAYRSPPRGMCPAARERRSPPGIGPAAYLRALATVADTPTVGPLRSLAGALTELVVHARATGLWDHDQGFRFEAARILADLETLIATCELTEPPLRRALGLPCAAASEAVSESLARFAFGWFGGRIAAALRTLRLRAGLGRDAGLDDAEDEFARASVLGRRHALGPPARTKEFPV